MKIGIFDSGIGGMTISNSLLKYNPCLEIVYFCDNKNFPYGTKSQFFIAKRLYAAFSFFQKRKVQNIIIACHSASSVYLQKYLLKTNLYIYKSLGCHNTNMYIFNPNCR
jgi:glutamate racemase